MNSSRFLGFDMPSNPGSRTISEMLANFEDRRPRAVVAAVRPNHGDREIPKDVFQEACSTIATSLKDLVGFSYSKSGRRCAVKSGEFTFQIQFTSSHRNVAGARVRLWIYASVRSAKIKKWRVSNQLQDNTDVIAFGQIGNLQAHSRWLEWELSDPTTRPRVVEDATRAIEELALPWFAVFEDVPALTARLCEAEYPPMSVAGAIEFLACFSDRSTARTAAVNFLKRRPEYVLPYRREHERLTSPSAVNKLASGYAEELARASLDFDFGDLAADLKISS